MKTSGRNISLTTLLFTLLIAVTGFAAIAYRHSAPPSGKSSATTRKPDKIIPAAAKMPDKPIGVQGKSAYANLPLTFELNQGQTDAEVKFLSRGNGYNLFLTPTESVLQLRTQALSPKPPAQRSATVRMKLVNANPNPEISGLDELPGKSNYFLGNDPKAWRTNVPNYAKVKYSSVYPGIDVVYYGNQRQLEYDLIVAPHADPSVIKLSFDGATKLRLNPQGDLELFTPAGKGIHHKPNLYQEINGIKLEIKGQYVLRGKNQVAFTIGAYNKSKPLVIDPRLIYATYLGGNNLDTPHDIAIDADGNAYVTGETVSPNFPTTSGAFQTTRNPGIVTFVSKLSADGSSLLYSTYLGSFNRLVAMEKPLFFIDLPLSTAAAKIAL